eukprot:4150668-Alexandrium_andersonii.AAC.1
MSASLVGSEMCIRDSHTTPRHGPWRPTRGFVCIDPCSRDVATASTEATVSYTHLTLPTICSV